MNACPDCDRPLPQTATSCQCGWTLGDVPVGVEVHRCADCPDMARMRIQVDGVWRKVCETHYLAYAKQAAEGALAKHGLERKPGESAQDHRKRLFAWLNENARVKRFGKAA